MTAAHRSLAFGTEVIVRNIDNGRSVRVKINDRGPFVDGRIIDLTRAAFAEIADLDKGLARVEIRVVK
jgi:rare lipoprotein A